MRLKEERRRQQIQRNVALGILLFVFCFVVWRQERQFAAVHLVKSPPPPDNAPPIVAARNEYAKPKKPSRLRGNVWIAPDAQPFNHNSLASHAQHLIIVAGHSVTMAGNLIDAGHDESVWYLLDYQKGKGLPQAIIGHIQAGIQAALDDEHSLLIFTGGETRATTGPVTEGSSYFRVADAMDLWKGNVRARTITEEFATDSFENLMFSLCRFYEVTGRYPARISMVSFTFKQRRFETLHAPALQWPSDKFSYIGVDPPASTGFDLAAATQGELENAARPFQTDPYGCHSAVLQEKRHQRNPFSRTPPYELSCPQMKELLHYCGPRPFPKSKLPWATL